MLNIADQFESSRIHYNFAGISKYLIKSSQKKKYLL